MGNFGTGAKYEFAFPIETNEVKLVGCRGGGAPGKSTCYFCFMTLDGNILLFIKYNETKNILFLIRCDTFIDM